MNMPESIIERLQKPRKKNVGQPWESKYYQQTIPVTEDEFSALNINNIGEKGGAIVALHGTSRSQSRFEVTCTATFSFYPKITV